MSTSKSDIVAFSYSPNTKDPTERLNNFDLRLQAFSQDPNDGAWSRPISRPKRDRKPKSNDEFYYY